MRCLLLSGIILATSFALVLSTGEMDAIYEWNYIDYLWDSEDQKQEFVKSGKYNFGSVLPMDVDRSVGKCPKNYNMNNCKIVIHALFQMDEFSCRSLELEECQPLLGL